ncbi:BA14K family protein [Mesorhizobium sp.]|uniref:BA14K family protein n=1 Tax=Mesorhizobium sp. TaxID=1871066 RepID=UPI000FE5D4CF|nr:BA14K family protein [Mesorhizobium sp.]RWA60989.1 MAG: BA14K family protein [Mesorhizobium sp.]
MKPLLGILGGFVLTLTIFASGLAFATWLLAAKPVGVVAPSQSVAELWTRNAERVGAAKEALERVPARPVPADPKPAEAAKPEIGPEVTASIEPPADEAPAAAGEGAEATMDLPASHVEWCESRYRSYRLDDNSYRSYSGEQRPCVSPYLDAGAADQGYVKVRDTSMKAAAMDGFATTYQGWPGDDTSGEGASAGVSADHIDYCFSRYRSYRPEDNSYQPYDGGPRQQCE